jgi:hypothetical protein
VSRNLVAEATKRPLCSVPFEFWNGRGAPSAANPKPAILDDPKLARDGLIDCRCRDLGDGGKHDGFALSTQSEHDDSRAAPGRVRSDVAEADVQRDERTTLRLNDREDLWVGLSAQPLVEHGDRVVAGGAKNLDALAGQILVELELHPAA